jgi:hypothetical protein
VHAATAVRSTDDLCASSLHAFKLCIHAHILQMALSQTLRLLQSYELAAVRCHMDVVEDPGNGTVTMLRVLAEPPLDAKM